MLVFKMDIKCGGSAELAWAFGTVKFITNLVNFYNSVYFFLLKKISFFEFECPVLTFIDNDFCFIHMNAVIMIV